MEGRPACRQAGSQAGREVGMQAGRPNTVQDAGGKRQEARGRQAARGRKQEAGAAAGRRQEASKACEGCIIRCRRIPNRCKCCRFE